MAESDAENIPRRIELLEALDSIAARVRNEIVSAATSTTLDKIEAKLGRLLREALVVVVICLSFVATAYAQQIGERPRPAPPRPPSAWLSYGTATPGAKQLHPNAPTYPKPPMPKAAEK